MCPSTAFHSVFLIIATVDGSASFFKSDNMALRTGRERWQHYEVDSGRGSLVCTSRHWCRVPGDCQPRAATVLGLSGDCFTSMVAPLPFSPLPCCHSIPESPRSQPHSRSGLGSAAGGSGGPAGWHTHACSSMGGKT